jgi:uncharacterized protein
MPRAILALAAALTAASAAAQGGPSFDCARADGSAQALVCADAALAALDRRLADRYAAALAVAKGLDAGAAEAEATLRAEQRGWIKGRDDCWKADDLRACVEDAYLRRIGLLTAMWMLDPPGETVFYQCGDSPADELAVIPFPGDPAAVRLERGDRVEPAVQTRAASGARYNGDFGVMFWSKGDEATLDWPPEAQGLTCRRR